jgi:uncharacterized protein
MSPRIFKLLTTHQRIDAALRDEQRHPLPDPIRVQRLKKMKLAIKDRLHMLSQRRRLSAA